MLREQVNNSWKKKAVKTRWVKETDFSNADK